jgi:hypothetical protein
VGTLVAAGDAASATTGVTDEVVGSWTAEVAAAAVPELGIGGGPPEAIAAVGVLAAAEAAPGDAEDFGAANRVRGAQLPLDGAGGDRAAASALAPDSTAAAAETVGGGCVEEAAGVTAVAAVEVTAAAEAAAALARYRWARLPRVGSGGGCTPVAAEAGTTAGSSVSDGGPALEVGCTDTLGGVDKAARLTLPAG